MNLKKKDSIIVMILIIISLGIISLFMHENYKEKQFNKDIQKIQGKKTYDNKMILASNILM